MSIEVTLEGTFKEEKDFEEYCDFIRETAIENHLKISDSNHLTMIEVCPEGTVFVSCEKKYLSISTQTNVAGPGYHAFICDFFQQLADRSPIALTVNDQSGYFEHRDFNVLKYGFFHRWLHDVIHQVKQIDETQEITSEACLSWPLDFYKPKDRPDCIVTPLGYISKDYFFHSDINEIAEQFFIWNDKGRNAHYYRNAALSLLWKDCYFEYSDMNDETKKAADTVIEFLEIAHEKDPTLPLPVAEYELLCEVRGHEKKLMNAPKMTQERKIGYRYDKVEHRYGNWNIHVDGFSEVSYHRAQKALYFMAPYHSDGAIWDWMITMVSLSGNLPTVDTSQEVNDNTITWEKGDMKARATVESVENYYTIHATFRYKKELLFIYVMIRDKKDIDKLTETLKSVYYKGYVMSSIQS